MDSARRLTAEHLRLALNTVGPPYKVALAGHIAALEQRIDELERKGSCDEHCVTQYRKVLDYAVATRMMLGGSNQHSAADRVLSRLASLESQLSGAVAALLTYGRHDPMCDTWRNSSDPRDCTCGLSAALRPAEASHD